MRAPVLGVVGVVLLSAACARHEALREKVHSLGASAAAVDEKRLLTADADASNWLTHGRNYFEQRFSPLKLIDATNVSQLKLAWFYDLPTAARAQESTPLVIDGVMYVTSAWSKVFALNSRTGELLWQFDPKVPGEWAINACCDVVNRGVAAWNGKVYVGTLDGRLIALDAKTGKPVWDILTIDKTKRYTITGAPRIVKGKVLIGNGGSEMGVRGYVSAYDAETGSLVWRFYTVPGEPGKPDGAASDAVLASKAQSTWTGEWWKLGGGGTVWDSMAYDPKLDMLYIGSGNGSPWNQAIRSPGGGDNLFLSSIIALRPDTGEYVWHYQETPGESWDYTATQHIILADLAIAGRERQVILHAPKNGFFYVIDRATGELISAQPFTAINWATGVNLKTGRPIENPEARYGTTGKPSIVVPGPGGAHNWTPMSFSPLTRLVYLPVTEMGFPYFPPAKNFEIKKLSWNVGVDLNAGSLPQDPAIKAQAKSGLKGHLAAWDPVAQKEVWRADLGHPWNGGVLSTAGNLVFQGNAMGEINAYQADTGARLWSTRTETGVLAPPITYEAGGQQYVTVEVGWGGAFGLAAGELARDSHVNKGNRPRVLTYKLNGSASLPPPTELPAKTLHPPPLDASEPVIAAGKALFHENCGTCHGDSAVSGGVLPDLRFSAALSDAGLWKNIVHDGALKDRGMISFAQELSPEQVETIRAYVVRRTKESMTEMHAAAQQAQK
jgi:quinohemoprotein ethanol dehydrogenase